MKILNTHAELIDWNRLVERARARLLTVALAEALHHLRTGYDAQIPDEVIERLRACPSPLFERAAHRALMRRPNTIRLSVATWDRYRRFSLLASAQERPSDFPDFLRRGWELEDRGLVRHVLGKVVRRNHRELAR
jgi:hypothetical protein